MSKDRVNFRFGNVLLLLALVFGGVLSLRAAVAERDFSFIVTADIREFAGGKNAGHDYFSGACEAIRDAGAGEFMISPGDIDPPQAIRTVLDKYFGPAYPWYPVVGNHEAETPADMEWLRAWGSNDIPGLVRRGPAGSEATTFSFDCGQAHFAVINQYFNGKKDVGSNGDVVDTLYSWLKEDLQLNRKKTLIVVGHEPIVAVPDMDNNRLRHEKDSLNAHPENSRRFHQLLLDQKVKAYLCAHTHNASITNLGGVWQIDAGHARGKGDPGAPSTFLRFRVTSGQWEADFYRQSKIGGPYRKTRTVKL